MNLYAKVDKDFSDISCIFLCAVANELLHNRTNRIVLPGNSHIDLALECQQLSGSASTPQFVVWIPSASNKAL